MDRPYDGDEPLPEAKHEEMHWRRLKSKVEALNSRNENQYKVLYIGRHGESYHNIAKAYYGADCWNVSSCPHATTMMLSLIISATGLGSMGMERFPGKTLS